MTASAAGTYILLVELSSPSTIEIGKLGRIEFDAGFYAYVGSARGPGGLTARLGRYTAGPARRHWHIDYLLSHAEVIGAIFRSDDERVECAWARWIGDRTQGRVLRFGSTDCRCDSHLFFVETKKDVEEMIRAAGRELKTTHAVGGR